MKRMLAVLLLIVATLLLVGCGKTGDCELCNKKDVSLEEVEIMGESAYVCEDCAAGFDAVEDALDDLDDLF